MFWGFPEKKKKREWKKRRKVRSTHEHYKTLAPRTVEKKAGIPTRGRGGETKKWTTETAWQRMSRFVPCTPLTEGCLNLPPRGNNHLGPQTQLPQKHIQQRLLPCKIQKKRVVAQKVLGGESAVLAIKGRQRLGKKKGTGCQTKEELKEKEKSKKRCTLWKKKGEGREKGGNVNGARTFAKIITKKKKKGLLE